jgi:O-methyltransferase
MATRSTHTTRRGTRARLQQGLNLALGNGALRARLNDGLARANLELAVRPPDEIADPEFEQLYQRCGEFTMTSRERMLSVCQAARYLAAAGVQGAVAECGVWRGGSVMMAALSFAAAGDTDRELWLYDTFEGMPEPTAEDTASWEADPHQEWARNQRDGFNEWCYSPLDEVRRNLASTGIDAERVEYVQGRVEDTLPGRMPDRIALLRLDTDWYESTRQELDHLFPRLVTGGVLIIDDYGHWPGVRKAVDEYLAEHGIHLLLQRIDYAGRMAVKV